MKPENVFSDILKKVLTELKMDVSTASELTPEEALKQLEELLVYNEHSSSEEPMIVLTVYRLAESHKTQLQPLRDLAHALHSRLILVSELRNSDLQMQHCITLKPYTEKELMSILTARVGTAVQPEALQCCVQKANGNARCATVHARRQ